MIDVIFLIFYWSDELSEPSSNASALKSIVFFVKKKKGNKNWILMNTGYVSAKSSPQKKLVFLTGNLQETIPARSAKEDFMQIMQGA
jgi:hypothetical protein